MAHLNPIYLLHSLYFTLQHSVVDVGVLQHAVNRHVHVLEHSLGRLLSFAQVSCRLVALLDDLAKCLQVHVHVLLDRRQQLDDNVLYHLALELTQLGLMVHLGHGSQPLLRHPNLLREMLRAQLHELHVLLEFAELTCQRTRVTLTLRLYLLHNTPAVNLLLLLHGLEPVDFAEQLLA